MIPHLLSTIYLLLEDLYQKKNSSLSSQNIFKILKLNIFFFYNKEIILDFIVLCIDKNNFFYQ